jgi:hypothetical protein
MIRQAIRNPAARISRLLPCIALVLLLPAAARAQLKTDFTEEDLRHLLQRTTFGPTLADFAFIQEKGVDRYLDKIVSFAVLDNRGTANKPLDLIEAADGSLYFSTFSAIWRIYK